MDKSTLIQITRELQDTSTCTNPRDLLWEGGLYSATIENVLCWLGRIAPRIAHEYITDTTLQMNEHLLRAELQNFAVARAVVCFVDYEVATLNKQLKFVSDITDLKYDQIASCIGFSQELFAGIDFLVARQIQNIEIGDFKTRSFGIADLKTRYCCCEPITELFRESCNGDDIDYSQSLTLNNYQRVSAWLMHYFVSRMPSDLAQSYHRFHTEHGFRRKYQCASVRDRFLIPGDIITTPLIFGVYHVGIVIGSFNKTVFIADLIVRNNNCAEVNVRTLTSFRRGNSVDIRRSINGSSRHTLWHTFNCISFIIGYNIKYKLTSTNCDSFINTVCFGLKTVSQMPLCKVTHRTMFTIHPSDMIRATSMGPPPQQTMKD